MLNNFEFGKLPFPLKYQNQVSNHLSHNLNHKPISGIYFWERDRKRERQRETERERERETERETERENGDDFGHLFKIFASKIQRFGEIRQF